VAIFNKTQIKDKTGTQQIELLVVFAYETAGSCVNSGRLHEHKK